MAPADTSRVGPFELLDKIGEGGMGKVFRARDPRLGREVAVKLLPDEVRSDPQRLRRFETEARAIASLSHPNILAVYEVGTHDGAPYLVSELLEGVTLYTRLAQGRLPSAKAAEIGAQIARGLAAAHRKGIVHRDLKPDNVFLTRDGHTKILDFGLARLAEGEALPEVATLTESGAVMGTAGYMSPEQVRGREADARADVFAFGAVLYEMLAGRRAFAGESPVDRAHAVLHGEPPPLPDDVPPRLADVVRRCLEKAPDDRFQSAADLAFALDGLTADAPRRSEGTTVRGATRGRAAMLVVGLALAALAGAGLTRLLAPRRVAAARTAQAPAPPPVVSYRPVTFRRGTVWSARFAPDGRSILYSAAWNGRPVTTYSAVPGQPEAREITAPATELLAVSSSGEMALAVQRHVERPLVPVGTLARAPVAGGEPRRVLERVRYADWTPDGRELVVLRQEGPRDVLEFPLGHRVWESTDSTGAELVRVSPDGKAAAFLRYLQDGTDLMLGRREGAPRTLVGGWLEISSLAWGPGGHEVWFEGRRREEDQRGLHAARLDGTVRELTRAPGQLTLLDVAPDGRALVASQQVVIGIGGRGPDDERDRDLSWFDNSQPNSLSADGRTLVFQEAMGDAEGDGAVYLRGMDGSPAVRLSDGVDGALSPDGRWVLVDVRRPQAAIALVPAGAGERRTLPRGRVVDFTRAVWLPDGRTFLFAGNEEGHESRLWLQSIDGGDPRPVTGERIGLWGWSSPISPDGQLVTAHDGENHFSIYPLGGGAPRPIPGLQGTDVPIQWAADGRLYVQRARGLTAEIHLVDLRTGRWTPFRDIASAEEAGEVHEPYVLLTPDGRSYAYHYHRILSRLYLVEGLR